MQITSSDLIHLVLGAGVIAGVTVLAALGKLDSSAVIPTYLAVVGVSGAVQIGSNSVRAIASQLTASAPTTPAQTGATNA